MKKLIFIAAVLFAVEVNAQNYLISFAGTGLSAVKVQNLSTGIIVEVPAGDILRLSTSTGIPDVNDIKSSRLKIYPNPMTDKSTLEILPPLPGDATITIYDMTGKVLTQFKGYVENSTQEFRLSDVKNGLHVITVQGNGYQFSEKLLSNGKSNGTAIITMVSNNIQDVTEKKSLMDSKGFQAYVDMAYNTGQRLKYTAVSGNTSTVRIDTPTTDNTVTFAFTECKDGDNINYPVVTIGTQTWMAENLNTTKYRNGDLIGTTDPATKDIMYETNPKYQWAYGGNESNVATYGRLYSWRALTDNRLVCPSGWHLPSDAEWKKLEMSLGMTQIQADGNGERGTDEGSKMEETGNTHWMSPAAGTNASGFTALPAGYRGNSSFSNIEKSCIFWSSNESTPETAWYRYLNYNRTNIDRNYSSKHSGFSVRCLKD